MPTRSGDDLATLSAPFVRGDAEPLRAALLVAPSPALAARRPLQSEPNSIPERAEEQHAIFAARLRAHGVAVRVLPAPEHAALGALCADAAVIFPEGAFLLRPSELNRRGEVAALEAALQASGVPVVARLASPGQLDGGEGRTSDSGLRIEADRVLRPVPLRRDRRGSGRTSPGRSS